MIDLPATITRDQVIRLIEETLKCHYGDVWRFRLVQGIERPLVADTIAHSPDGADSTESAAGHRHSVESALTQALACVAEADVRRGACAINNHLNILEERSRSKSDDELVAMFSDPGGWAEVVLQSAKDELRRRGYPGADDLVKVQQRHTPVTPSPSRSFIVFVVFVVLLVVGILVVVSVVDIELYMNFRGPAGIVTLLFLAFLLFKLSAGIAGIVEAIIHKGQASKDRNNGN